MKKLFAILTAVCLMTAMTGCGEKNASLYGEGNDANTAVQTVSTDGSTSMEKVIGYLSEAYMAENPDTKVTYNPTGSSAGIQAVMDGRCDIGLSSRDLKDDEKERLDYTVVAIDGIAVIVSKENTAEDLTLEQVTRLYRGEITNWSELGGADSPVVLIGRETASGTRDGFESITDTKDACQYSQELTSTGDVIQTVASNPGAIGYASLASVNDTVKTLTLEGVAPTVETIQSGEYKLQRNFEFVTPKDKALSDSAQKFYDYVTGGGADSLIEEAGAIPVK